MPSAWACDKAVNAIDAISARRIVAATPRIEQIHIQSGSASPERRERRFRSRRPKNQ
jgi:hypothetical protein